MGFRAFVREQGDALHNPAFTLIQQEAENGNEGQVFQLDMDPTSSEGLPFDLSDLPPLVLDISGSGPSDVVSFMRGVSNIFSNPALAFNQRLDHMSAITGRRSSPGSSSQRAEQVGGRMERTGQDGRMSDLQRVLLEAERVMGRPQRRDMRMSVAVRGSGGEQEQRGTDNARPSGVSDQTDGREPTNVDDSSDPSDPTVPRFTSMSEDIREICTNTVTRVNSLLRAVTRRAQEGRALPDEVSRTSQIAEIILGIRGGFSDEDVIIRSTRHPMNMTRVEMETILLNQHHDNPEWQENDTSNEVLQNFHSCIEEGDLIGMLKLIPRMRHPIYHRDVAGETALHVACLHGREEEAQLLLDMGHYADPCCLDGSTPLADAASGGFANLVALLAMRTPHCINMVDVDGDGPLHNAARGDHPDVVRILLEVGADTTATNSDGERPIDYAIENSRCHRLLSSRLAEIDGKDREVLRLFSLYSSHDTENEGFAVVDLISLSNNRLSPDHVVGAVHRLVGLGALESRGIGDTHWALVDPATLAELGLVYE